MNNWRKFNGTRYFLYARKSSDRDDRQIQSIDDQVDQMKKIAVELDLKLVDILTETKSAKAPNKRPVFSAMIDRIIKGEADGILTWQMNRLSRNPVDSGQIQWLLQEGTLKSIYTHEREYRPEDNALLLSIEGGQATQFIKDLKINTKRGLSRKVSTTGWLPNYAPLGYKNDKEGKTIIEDQERFPLVRKMWDLMLTGSYTVRQIHDIANNDWGFHTRKSKKSGDKPISMSGLYRVFSNIFYTGTIKYGGQKYPGNHKVMVTPDEFRRVQQILKRTFKAQPKTRTFAFTGLMRCGSCGCLITAETKTKTIKATNEPREYTYYHCTHRKNDIECQQRGCVRVEDIEKQVLDILGRFNVDQALKDWALDALKATEGQVEQEREVMRMSQEKALESARKQLESLTLMKCRDQIGDEEYAQLRSKLLENINRYRLPAGAGDGGRKLTETVGRVFDFASLARQAFISGNDQIKREIFTALGSNQTLDNGKVLIQASDWLAPLQQVSFSEAPSSSTLEPMKLGATERKTPIISDERSTWLRGWDSNPEPMDYSSDGWTMSSP